MISSAVVILIVHMFALIILFNIMTIATKRERDNDTSDNFIVDC